MNGDVNGDMYSRVSSEMCITGADLNAYCSYSKMFHYIAAQIESKIVLVMVAVKDKYTCAGAKSTLRCGGI